MGRVDLKSMPVVTVEQVARFREAAIAENSALLELVRVQHEALGAAKEFGGIDKCTNRGKWTTGKVRAALAKYNEMVEPGYDLVLAATPQQGGGEDE